MKKVHEMIDKLLEYEWKFISVGLVLRPFDWQLVATAEKYYVVGQLGPLRVWAELN